MKTQLNNEIELIPDTAIRQLCAAVLEAAPDCFWTMPAATTGKYHPQISLGTGGLVRHTKAVVRLTLHLLNMAGIPEESSEYSLAIAAALLHDCCKKSDEETYTAFDHPTRAAQLIAKSAAILHTLVGGYKNTTIRTLCNIVECHMGRWNVCPRTGQTLPIPLTPLQRLVHTADYLASRKDITIADIS